MTSFLWGLAGFATAFFLGSLVEYLVHRFMHAHPQGLGHGHVEHHQRGDGQGVYGEFRDYVKPGIPFLWIGFLHSVPSGIGGLVGGILYALFAAYSHQLNHDQPDLVFWLPRPVHHLHHTRRMWRHNFGIAVDIWDRIFGTYQAVPWQRQRPLREYSWRSFFDVKWYEPPA